MEERRSEIDQLRGVLENKKSTPEEKRQAIDALRAKRKLREDAMLREMPQKSPAEKAAARERMKEWLSRLPPERSKLVEGQIAISDDMNKLREEGSNLSSTERASRMRALMERRRALMQQHMPSAEREAADQDDHPTRERTSSPYRNTIVAERQKLDAALADKDPERRRLALRNFRDAMDKIREERLREMESRRLGLTSSTQEPRLPEPPPVAP